MTSTIVDVVVLVALVVTALRVASMHRELRKLRGYQTQYVQVFGETSRAADNIGEALRQIGGEGKDALVRLEAAIQRAGELSGRLEAMALAAAPRPAPARADDLGLYSRHLSPAPVAPAPRETKNEILKFDADSRRLPERSDDPIPAPRFSPRPFDLDVRPEREFRLAPSVSELRAGGGAG